MKRFPDALRVAGLSLVLFRVGACLGSTGCASARERTDQAIVLATYERELDHCLTMGKASGSYQVYEACAKAVDRQLCADRGVRCVDGGR